MSRVLLVNPPRPRDGRYMDRSDRCESAVPDLMPPHTLCKVGGVLRDADGHDVGLLDLNADSAPGDYSPLERIVGRERFDFVVFRATPETFAFDLRTASIVKTNQSSAKTILLCWNMTPIAESIMRQNDELDFYVTNDDYTEVIRALVCEDKRLPGLVWRDGTVITRTQNKPIPTHFSEYPMPAWDLISHNFGRFFVQLPVLHPWVPMETIEGCHLGCTFCVYADSFPKFRRPEDAIDEFVWLREHGVKYISFFDATFNLNRKRAEDLCNEILSRRAKSTWYANIRADFLDKDLVDLMARAGCEGVSCGVESANPEILKNVHKEAQSPEVVEQATSWLKAAGLKTYYSFVIGLPGETKESIKKTTNYILKVRPNSLQINTYTPYPKTPLYAVAKEMGYEVGNNLVLYDACAADFSLCELTPKELSDARMKMYDAFYGSSSWWLSNVKWTLQHPKDIKIGVNYVYEIAKAKMGIKADHCGPYWVS